MSLTRGQQPGSWDRSAPILRDGAMRLLRAMDELWDALFGVASLIIGLALLANIPVLQIASLGYLREVSRRVGASGRLRDAFVGVRKASRLGSVGLTLWLMWRAPSVMASLWHDALLISPAGAAAQNLRWATAVLCAWIVVHAGSAAFRGGRLRHFLWPRPLSLWREITRPGGAAEQAKKVAEFASSLRFPYYFAQGARGLATGVAWLFVPTSLLIVGARSPAALLLGAIGMVVVALTLPVLQARVAMRQGMAGAFRWRDAMGDLRRAPVPYLAAIGATLVLATPLYLAKIELLPREASWLPSLLFVVGAWPARALCGWAVASSLRHQPTTWRLVLATCSLAAAIPLALGYTGLSYLTQYVSWYGPWSLYEQHAFLLPAPFLGWGS